MVILILIGIFAILGIATEDVHKKARPLLKEEGYKLIFFIRYSDVKKFLSDETISVSKKEKLKKLVKKWLYLTISAGIVFITSIIVAIFFPSLVMV